MDRPRGESALRRRRRLLLALLVPALLTGCTAGPSDRPAMLENDEESAAPTTTSPQDVPLPPLAEPRSPTIHWSDCDQQTFARFDPPAVPDSLSLTCATVMSVLDAPDLPGRVPIDVALLKAGDGPIPLVVLNDVEGEAGTAYAAHLAASLPPELLQRFSLIGVDRRGTGDSDPLGCLPPEVHGPLLSQDPAGAGIDGVLDAARRSGQQCAIDLGSSQLAIDSWRAAGDLEEIRDALGTPTLNAIAHGEASRVLISYAARFPKHLGRVVLDGIPDPSPDPATKVTDQAEAQLAVLGAFARDCAARHCALGTDATSAVNALLDQLRSAPGPAIGGVGFGPGLAINAIAVGLANPVRWPELGDAIQAARGGDLSKLTAFVAPLVNGTEPVPSRLDGALATECNDSADRLSVNQISALADQLRSRFAPFGALATQRLTWCLPWPGNTNTPVLPGNVALPPILVTSALADPVTPEPGTARAAQQLPSAVRVSWQGAGHAALMSPCVADAVRAFLVDGKVPANGTLCPA
ncbi:alpha/beta hydrolase [Amycolatopsis taiwanensis]|uniref:alpha/beta hydrolase n=1 Tax=Amycolatopsis taiwanensis TaxID=342230 RepID=UPI00047FC6E5|nr:alpha/beta hydrolase [Amycolatopsis taiwanensis]